MREKTGVRGSFWRDFKRRPFIYMMLVPVIAYFLVFKYFLLYGEIIAFKDFRLAGGIWGSKWVGLVAIQYLDWMLDKGWFALKNGVENTHRKLAGGAPQVIDAEKFKKRGRLRQRICDRQRRHVEYVGHEVWAYNGSGMYVVKYPHSPDKPTGVYFVDKTGERARLVNGDYPYWHVGVSPDGRYAAADTQEPGISQIVLIDIAGGRSELLCEMPCRGIHPGHPHPSFSPDSRKVTFTYADEQDVLCVGIIDIGRDE